MGEQNIGKCRDIGEDIHPSFLPGRSHDYRGRQGAPGDHERWSRRYFRRPLSSLALNFLDCCFLWAGWTNTAPTLPRVTSRHQLLSQVQCVNLRNNQKSPERGNNWSRPIIGQTWPYLKTVHSLSNAFWPPSPSRSSRKGTYIKPDNRKFCRGRQSIQKLESVFTVDIIYAIFLKDESLL